MIILTKLSETLQNDLAARSINRHAMIRREESALGTGRLGQAHPRRTGHVFGHQVGKPPSHKRRSSAKFDCLSIHFTGKKQKRKGWAWDTNKLCQAAVASWTRYRYLVSGAPWEPAASAGVAMSR